MLCIRILCSTRINRVHLPFLVMEPAGLSISVRSPHWKSRTATELPAWLLLSSQTAPVPCLHIHGEPQPCIVSGFLQNGCSHTDHLRLLHRRAVCGKTLPLPPGSSGASSWFVHRDDDALTCKSPYLSIRMFREVIVILACPRAAWVIDGVRVDLISGIDHKLLVTGCFRIWIHKRLRQIIDVKLEFLTKTIIRRWEAEVNFTESVCRHYGPYDRQGACAKLINFDVRGRAHMCLRRHEPLAPRCQRSCYLVVMSVKVIQTNYCVKKYVENTEIWNKIWVRSCHTMWFILDESSVDHL